MEVKSWREIGVILSSFQGSEQCLELLIGHFGPSIVNLRDHRGRTPLHVAAFHNNLDCMQLLLSHGASVEARDITGKTPLLVAAYSGQCSAIGESW
jgi:serine/threonine-protein phosphatase 6 regulatory ankyrin repeat subunit A